MVAETDQLVTRRIPIVPVWTCAALLLCATMASAGPLDHPASSERQEVRLAARQDPVEVPIRRFRKQAVQKLPVLAGSLLATSNSDLSSSFFQTSLGLGVPLGNFENILGVTPSFRVDWLDAADTLDVPDELFEAGVNLFWRKPLRDRLSAMAMLRPSYRSDFTTSDRALRLFGLALINWEHTPDCLTLSFGAVWLGRADLPVLPAVGLTWTPQPRTRVELRFPESKLAWRLAKDGAQSETWARLSMGIGGNTWAVTRASGLSDELSLRDIRVRLGLEHIVDGGGGWIVEAGYAFARRVEYEQTATEISLSDGVLLQAGWTW